jgi:hypothetical protein
MPEVQKHGFSWEKDLIHNVYGATPAEMAAVKYTSKMDLPSALNHKDGVDVSIKATGTPNSVCMADCLRVYDEVSSGKPLHLTVVTYKQDDEANTKTLTAVTEVDLTNSVAQLFGDRVDRGVGIGDAEATVDVESLPLIGDIAFGKVCRDR